MIRGKHGIAIRQQDQIHGQEDEKAGGEKWVTAAPDPHP
jgi:hypothetical protein